MGKAALSPRTIVEVHRLIGRRHGGRRDLFTPAMTGGRASMSAASSRAEPATYVQVLVKYETPRHV